ncbi:MAG: sigma-70 family RNA polymerase sigma factor [Clostridia bacterium]|nr:sigma-70 family RNA polymerase sigma factor [Clostridia bacterium]
MARDFDSIYREYGRQVYFYLLSLCGSESLSEELTQETMLRALLNIDGFRGDCKLSTWLCTIARNLYRDWLRKNRHLPLEEADRLPAEENPAETVSDRDMAARILAGLERLDEPYREVFTLHVMRGLTLKEISCRMGKSESWARVTYYRAKTKIIEGLGEIK